MIKPTSPLFRWQHRSQDELRTMLHDHVDARDFPCVGAKSALARNTLEVLACDSIDSAWDDLRIHDALLAWAKAWRDDPGMASGCPTNERRGRAARAGSVSGVTGRARRSGMCWICWRRHRPGAVKRPVLDLLAH